MEWIDSKTSGMHSLRIQSAGRDPKDAMDSRWNAIVAGVNEPDQVGINLFVEMSSLFRSGLPPSLIREDPTLLVRLLRLGLREGGITQSDMERHLRINQPRLSKLIKKLVAVRWIKIYESEADGRLRLVTTTGLARSRLDSLEGDLAALLSSKPRTKIRRKGIPHLEGQQDFLGDFGKAEE